MAELLGIGILIIRSKDLFVDYRMGIGVEI